MASKDPNVIRIKPYFYVHVLDNNTNVTRVEVGPNTYTRQVQRLPLLLKKYIDICI